eukprot:10381636-Heterocapsa_arctica.AAC.1
MSDPDDESPNAADQADQEETVRPETMMDVEGGGLRPNPSLAPPIPPTPAPSLRIQSDASFGGPEVRGRGGL